MKNHLPKIISFFALCLSLFSIIIMVALAATPPPAPGALPTTCVEVHLPKFFGTVLPDPCSSPAAYIQYWFYFGLYLGGFIALLALVGAGVYRVVAAHNPVSVGKADSYIVNAVLGLILLFGSWLLLNTLGGPGLTTVRDPVLPNLPPIGVVNGNGTAGEACSGSSCPSGLSCSTSLGICTIPGGSCPGINCSQLPVDKISCESAKGGNGVTSCCKFIAGSPPRCAFP